MKYKITRDQKITVMDFDWLKLVSRSFCIGASHGLHLGRGKDPYFIHGTGARFFPLYDQRFHETQTGSVDGGSGDLDAFYSCILSRLCPVFVYEVFKKMAHSWM